MWLQSYIWDANCSTHHTGLLHFAGTLKGEGITVADEHGITGADELQLVITVVVPNTSGHWEFSGIL
jgi:purine-nucleoside phosphorylase